MRFNVDSQMTVDCKPSLVHRFIMIFLTLPHKSMVVRLRLGSRLFLNFGFDL